MIPNLGRDMTTAELREVPSMTLNDYQQSSRNTAVYATKPVNIELVVEMYGLIYSVLALCGEAGELANKLKKYMRSDTMPDPEVLADELGDVQWYVASTAHHLGKSLQEIAEQNLAKLAARKAADKLKGVPDRHDN